MIDSSEAPCGCNPCVGETCACGCQDATARTACGCGEACRCGESCACASE